MGGAAGLLERGRGALAGECACGHLGEHAGQRDAAGDQPAVDTGESLHRDIPIDWPAIDGHEMSLCRTAKDRITA